MKISIIGSTGSIGKNTLKVVEHLRNIEIEAIAGGRNLTLLQEQAETFGVPIVCTAFPELCSELKSITNKKVLCGIEGLNEIATLPCVDKVVISSAGASAFFPLYNALKNKKTVALANKESLVAYGGILNREIPERKIIPVDSEHSAVFQCLEGKNINEVRGIILTASGGPFRDRNDLSKITLDETLAHPTWDMGKKITVDSATLMNKGFEVIEAVRLFRIPPEKIEVVIHPQSIIHSMIEMIDTSVFAQLSYPDMKLPIQFALTYPKRKVSLLKPLDFTEIEKLEFFTPDFEKFPLLKLAYKVIEKDGNLPAILAKADEIMVNKFLEGKSSFLDIQKTVIKVVEKAPYVKEPSISDIQEAEKWVEEEIKRRE